MKKSTYTAIASVLSNIDFQDKETIMDELYTEINRGAVEKAKKNDEYNTAWGVIQEVLASTKSPLTVAEIFTEAKKSLPDGFAKGRVQYGLTHEWTEQVVKIEGKPNTYRLK